ncbi:MAG: hypothetical protein LBB26_02485 [Puniceicoccales bacterium]|jgi:hypothetical protein|nr:hypothetical protein [Puniceicoccales bacterium]
MKNTTASTTDVFDDDLELQTSLVPELAPSFKLEPPFLWKFPAFLGRASPLRKTFKNVANKQKTALAHPIGESMKTN